MSKTIEDVRADLLAEYEAKKPFPLVSTSVDDQGRKWHMRMTPAPGYWDRLEESNRAKEAYEAAMKCQTIDEFVLWKLSN